MPVRFDFYIIKQRWVLDTMVKEQATATIYCKQTISTCLAVAEEETTSSLLFASINTIIWVTDAIFGYHT